MMGEGPAATTVAASKGDLAKLRRMSNGERKLWMPRAVRCKAMERSLGRPVIPNCAVEYIVPPWPSPFGYDYLSSLAQLKLLENWGPTLDSLAPSYKISIWRISKLFEDFGSNHDMTSFKKTIARWVQSPLENLDSIRLLFSSIGYLKNAGVLKHEFFYPFKKHDSVLYPVFRSKENDHQLKTMKRKRKRKKNLVEPSRDNPVVMDNLLEENIVHTIKPYKLKQNFISAFKPLRHTSPHHDKEISVKRSKLSVTVNNNSNIVDRENEEFNAELRYALGLL